MNLIMAICMFFLHIVSHLVILSFVGQVNDVILAMKRRLDHK